MFVVRPQPDQVIAVYGEDSKLLGTIKFKAAPQGKGRCGLALDFPREIRFDTDYRSNAVVTVKPPTFGDFNADEYQVPKEADNDFL